MNILVLNYEYPPLGGGAGNISRHISQNLVLKGHRVYVVTSWFNGLPEYENLEGKPEIVRLRSKRKQMYRSTPLEMISWINHAKKHLTNHLPDHSYDICLANFSIPGGVVARDIQKKFKIPYVVLSHGHDIPWYYPRQMFFFHLFTYFKIKTICKNSARNFIQTEYMKKNIDKFLGKKRHFKNIIISNGAEFKNGKITHQRKLEPFTILLVGRFVQQKDPITLLLAIKKLSRMDIPFKLILIGDGPMRKKMERFVTQNKIENVTFTGWVEQEKVALFYQKAHVIITPSRTEGMSIANLEALASGVFLIGTPVSGNSEMISGNKNGVLVEIGNYNEIANQLQKFYFEQYLPKNFTAEHSANELYGKFNWSVITERYAEEFLTIKREKQSSFV
jgi:glycosyltransferase involved in cell wall biosynthesis